MILYFSGTGNSRYAAEAISKLCGDTELVNLFEVIKSGKNASFHSEKPFVVCAPTYAWRLPRVVEKAILNAELSGNKKMYFVMTCGGETGNAQKYLERLCNNKGLEYMGLGEIVMPENYIAMFKTPDEFQEKAIMFEANKKIPIIATRISEELPLQKIKSGASGKLMSGVVNPVFYKFFVKDKGFYTTDKCNSCKACAEVCPMGNITFEDSKPKWNGNCTHCMACISKCPQCAVEYKKNSVGQRRYVNHKKYGVEE